MIAWTDLHKAISAVAMQAATDAGIAAELVNSEPKRPITRASIKIDLSSNVGALGNSSSRERSFDAEIYFYPTDEHNYRDECMQMADALTNAYLDGLIVNDFYIALPDGISCDITSGVLAGRLQLDWVEVLPEDTTSEIMEELEYNIETEG